MPLFTLADLRTRALDRLDGNAILYTNPELDWVINEAVRITALFTGFYRATVQLPEYTTAGIRIYDVPAGILVPTAVAFEGRQLQKISLKKLARKRRNWATDTTATHGQVEFWAPVGITRFVISPLDAAGGNDITLTGMAEPPLLVLPADVMQLENEYVELITEYCAHRLPLKEGGKIFTDASMGLNTYYSKMNERRRFTKLAMPKYYRLQPKEAAA